MNLTPLLNVVALATSLPSVRPTLSPELRRRFSYSARVLITNLYEDRVCLDCDRINTTGTALCVACRARWNALPREGA